MGCEKKYDASTGRREGARMVQLQSNGTPDDLIANVSADEITDLSATLTAPAFVARGEQISVSFRVHNAGPSESAVVSARLELGGGLNIANMAVFGSASTPTQGALGTCLTGANTLSCQIPQLPSGGSITFNVTTYATTSTGSFAHTAFVQGSGTDLSLANNSASAATTVSDAVAVLEPVDNSGGGSIALWMLAALLTLSCARALSVRVEQAEPNVSRGNRLLTTLGRKVSRRR
jgi:hypothetical protein